MPADCDVRLLLTCTGGRATCGFSVASGDFNRSLQSYAEDTWEAAKDTLLKATSFIWILRSATTRKDGAQAIYLEDKQGEVSSDSTMLSTVVLVSKIPIVGRPGRMYWPGLTESQSTAQGRLSVQATDLWRDEAENFLGKLDDKGLQMVMRRANGDLDPVLQLVPRPYAGRQDRRLVASRRA